MCVLYSRKSNEINEEPTVVINVAIAAPSPPSRGIRIVFKIIFENGTNSDI
jgi:hypothetical protein